VDDFNLEGGDPFRASLARDTIGRALSVLSQELRMVVILRYWGDLSLAEIADRLRIPIGTVKSRHHAALQALRRRIEPAEGGTR
jgi:RNA polymerase sigma factor (sigma-70 family)